MNTNTEKSEESNLLLIINEQLLTKIELVFISTHDSRLKIQE